MEETLLLPDGLHKNPHKGNDEAQHDDFFQGEREGGPDPGQAQADGRIAMNGIEIGDGGDEPARQAENQKKEAYKGAFAHDGFYQDFR
jgi:hypothetical protein